MNTQQAESRNEFVQSLVDLGNQWVALGISFGSQALERSAKSLELAAKTLNVVAKGFEKVTPASSAPAATETSEPVAQDEAVDQGA